jgi:lipoate-protein ligase A
LRDFFLQGFAERKVVNGKMIQATVSFQQSIRAVRFSGDFFLHPEEILEAIERVFFGLPVGFDSVETVHTIQQLLEKNKAELVGIAPTDLVAVVQEAIQIGQNE